MPTDADGCGQGTDSKRPKRQACGVVKRRGKSSRKRRSPGSINCFAPLPRVHAPRVLFLFSSRSVRIRKCSSIRQKGLAHDTHTSPFALQRSVQTSAASSALCRAGRTTGPDRDSRAQLSGREGAINAAVLPRSSSQREGPSEKEEKAKMR